VPVIRYLADTLPAVCHAVDAKKRTALHWCASNGNPEVAKMLVLEYHVDPLQLSSQGLGALHVAAMYGELAVVQFLVEHCSVPVDQPDGTRQTALGWAAQRNEFPTFRYLIEHGADVLAQSESGRTMLHNAAINGHVTLVKFLLESNYIDQNVVDANGSNCVHLAVLSGSVRRRGAAAAALTHAAHSARPRAAAAHRVPAQDARHEPEHARPVPGQHCTAPGRGHWPSGPHQLHSRRGKGRRGHRKRRRAQRAPLRGGGAYSACGVGHGPAWQGSGAHACVRACVRACVHA
jgi:hypothetical protein